MTLDQLIRLTPNSLLSFRVIKEYVGIVSGINAQESRKNVPLQNLGQCFAFLLFKIAPPFYSNVLHKIFTEKDFKMEVLHLNFLCPKKKLTLINQFHILDFRQTLSSY